MEIGIPLRNGCEEASLHSRDRYIPCCAPARKLVFHIIEQRVYLMCDPCADHNITRRGGILVGEIPVEHIKRRV